MKLKVYGGRGSIPIAHLGGSLYGGNTSCITVESGGETLILDAGSGLMLFQHDLEALYPDYPNNIPDQHILISHLHLDHIIGLGMFKPMFATGSNTYIYTCSRDERPLKEQVFGAYKAPLWPTDMSQSANAQCIEAHMDKPFQIGPFTVTFFLANHSDLTASYHISDGHKTLVHLLDSELSTMAPDQYSKLIDYCKDADMVVADTAYSPEDYPKYKGWGHSTIEHAVTLSQDCGCKKMLMSHFSQHYSDAEITSWAKYAGDPNKYILATEGMEILL